MKTGRKMLYAFIVTLFVAISMFTSVYAADITHDYSLRGNGNDNSSPVSVTGKICRMTDDTFYMYIDQGTAYRNITVRLNYMTKIGAGVYTIRDYMYIYNNMQWGNPLYIGDATVSRSLTNVAFAWVPFSPGSDQGLVALTASGANSSFYFRIYDAEFNFSNY